MVKVIDKKVALSSEELKLLGEGKEYELIPNQKGVFLLIEKQIVAKNEGKQVCVSVPMHEELVNPLEEEKEQVLGLIKKGKLSELVEGKFEELLNDSQKKALTELIKEGEIFIFKLNESYKRGVYRVKEEEENENRTKKDSEDFNAVEKSLEEYNLDNDGFLAVKNTDKARSISYEYEGMIKEGLLKGIRAFDGTYYLLQTNLLKNGITKIANAFNGAKSLTIEELAQKINYSKILTRIVCEFLKEEGEILEKRKGQYAYIK
jgi:hypothetical protein